MSLWKILVMGVLRLDLNCDYDRLQELVNQHNTVRKMLGHSDFFDKDQYNMQTIKDSVRLLTPELLAEINEAIVKAGHELLGKKKENEPLRGRCDSFVVETDVHFPTDINLLFDAVRKVIQLTAQLSENYGMSDWRQHAYNVKQVKRQTRIVQKKKRVSGKTQEQKVRAEKAVKQSNEMLIKLSQRFLNKSEITRNKVVGTGLSTAGDLATVERAKHFSEHAERQIDQIERRILQGEVIPHEEKVFSIFEPHTEWISKGKAGVPVELGLRVCILEDHHQFILHHKVMEKETDDRIAIEMVKQSKSTYPSLTSCSFDRGFHSSENQRELKKYLDVVALKRKGKLSQKVREIEATDKFKKARDKHSAVESAINALEVHGLDKCRDHGIDGFKRYVGLAVLTRNIHRIGAILHQRVQKKLAREKNRGFKCIELLAA